MTRVRKARVLAAALPATFLILAATAWADPVLAESMGLDVWQIGRLEDDLKRTQGVGGRLDVELAELQEVMAVNDLILADLVAGRVSLSEAAMRKWDVNRHRATIREHLSFNCEGETFEQKMAVDFYQRICFGDPLNPPAAGVAARLRTEYEGAYHVSAPAVASEWCRLCR